jgi:hypothetical protein
MDATLLWLTRFLKKVNTVQLQELLYGKKHSNAMISGEMEL